MKKVWVLQESFGRDFRPAEEYGPVQFVLPAQAGARLNSTHEALAEWLEEYRPQIDYLVLAGANAVCLLVGHMLAQRNIRKLKLLRWHAANERYVEGMFEMPELVINTKPYTIVED